LTPGVSSFSKKLVVRMGFYTPALFLASGQRASGVHERPYKAELHKLCFFSIIRN